MDKMVPILLIVAVFAGVNCEPETVRDNFDYFNYGTNEDNMLKNLDLHPVRNTVELNIFPFGIFLY